MNPNVSLTDELANFVTSKVAAARYSSSSEVVREALRLMEKIERQEAEKFQFLRNVTPGRKESTAATPARLTYRSRSSPIGASPSRSRTGDR